MSLLAAKSISRRIAFYQLLQDVLLSSNIDIILVIVLPFDFLIVRCRPGRLSGKRIVLGIQINSLKLCFLSLRLFILGLLFLGCFVCKVVGRSFFVCLCCLHYSHFCCFFYSFYILCFQASFGRRNWALKSSQQHFKIVYHIRIPLSFLELKPQRLAGG